MCPFQFAMVDEIELGIVWSSRLSSKPWKPQAVYIPKIRFQAA
jgi:hypothetical protein